MAVVDYGGVSKLWDKGVTVARNAVYAPNPMTQIVTNLVIIVVLILSSSVGLVVGIPLAGVALVLLGVGVVRLLWQFITR